MKRSKINPISKKKAAQIKEEKEIRKQLNERSQGRCEECGEPDFWPGLHPHERVFRSHGGKMTLENSIVLCTRCHGKRHNINYIVGEK